MRFNNRQVEVEIAYNRDGSKYILKAHFADTGDDLTYDEIEHLQAEYEDSLQLNGLWG